MSCYQDVEKAILDKIFEDHIGTMPSYVRIGRDVLGISNKPKNKSKENPVGQARIMIKLKAKKILQEYNGHLRLRINDKRSDTPVSSTIVVNPDYVEYVHNTQVKGEKRASQEDNNTLFSPSSPSSEQINYTLKSVSTLQSSKAIEAFKQGEKNNWSLDKILSVAGVEGKQKDIIVGLAKNQSDNVENLLNSEEITYTDENNNPCASKGGATSFIKGGKWELIKDFKGASHEKGGIDINISDGKISMNRKQGKFEAKFGVVISKQLLK